MTNRLLFLMIDGLGDTGIISKSADARIVDILAEAKVPNISKYFIASPDGLFGLMDPVEPGLACGSDTAHLSIFGFDPKKYYSGRGAFETVGAGLKVSPCEIAFKCNFSHLNSDGIVEFRRVDKDFSKEAEELCFFIQKELNRDCSCTFGPKNQKINVFIQYATEHRCVIKIGLDGLNLSDQITGTDPLQDNLPFIYCKPLDPQDVIATLTANIVQTVSDKISNLLESHAINIKRKEKNLPTANVVLFRGCSKAPDLPPFDSINKVEWSPIMLAQTCIISGIGVETGFHTCHTDKVCHETEESVQKDSEIILNELLKYRPDCKFAFFHIKAVDEAGHDQNAILKIHWIEYIDNIIGILIEKIKTSFIEEPHNKVRIVLTGDHSTLCRTGEHSCEPVPFLVSEPISTFRKETASTESQSESELKSNDNHYRLSQCFETNSIGRFSGESVIELLKHLVIVD